MSRESPSGEKGKETITVGYSVMAKVANFYYSPLGREDDYRAARIHCSDF